jgi:hypothetical protein
MPFELTPFFPRLARLGTGPNDTTQAADATTGKN